MWAGYMVKTLSHLGFTTNNFVESHNAKIKPVLNHQGKLADVIRQLSLLESTKVKERNVDVRRKFTTCVRITESHGSNNTVKQAVFQTATVHAAKLLMTEIEKANKTSSMQVTENGACSVQIGEGRQHVVSQMKYCDCCHFVTTGLPCVHIFAVRAHEGLSKYAVELVPERWLRKVYAESMHEFSQSQSGSVQSCRPVQRTHPKSVQENFREASVTTDALANLLAGIGQQEFSEKLSKLNFLLNVWKDGRDVTMEDSAVDEHVEHVSHIDQCNNTENNDMTTNNDVEDVVLEHMVSEASIHVPQ